MELSESRRAAARGIVWGLRAWMLVYLVSAAAQPVLAGAYLEGDYDAIGAHGLIGSAALSLLVMGAGALALASALVGGTSWWPVLVTGVLFFAQGFQIGMGHTRALLVHIPLGVAIVAAVAVLTVWVWRPRFAAGSVRR